MMYLSLKMVTYVLSLSELRLQTGIGYSRENVWS